MKTLLTRQNSVDNGGSWGKPVVLMITRRTLIPLLVAVLAPFFACGPFLPVQRAHAEAITVIPPKFELFGNPGDIISEKLKVRNDGDTEVVYQIQIEDFQASGEQGGVNLIDDPNY